MNRQNNKIMNFIACAIMITMVMGCNKFLDIKPKGKDVPRTIEHFDGLLNNSHFFTLTYAKPNPGGNGYMFTRTGDPFCFYMTDELVLTDEANIEKYAIEQREAYKFEDDVVKFVNQEINDWNAAYTQIYTFNVIIDNVMDAENGSVEKKKAVRAEARVRRAYNHFLMAEFYGKPYREATANTDLGIPLVTEATIGKLTYIRSTNRETYDFILSEMKEAIPDLKSGCDTPIRLGRAAGYFLLAKIHFAMKQYDKAVEALQFFKTELDGAATPRALFDYTDDSKTFTLWGFNKEMPHTWTRGYPKPEEPSHTETIHAFYVMSYTTYAYPLQVMLGYGIKDEYMDLFSENDRRKRFFSKKGAKEEAWTNYRRINKYDQSISANLPEYYLMLAECYARNNNDTEARTALMELRKKRIVGLEEAAIPAEINTKEALIKFIVEERLREYLMTGLRWFDMRRLWDDPLFNDLKKNYVHTLNGKTYTLTEKRLCAKLPPRELKMCPELIDNE